MQSVENKILGSIKKCGRGTVFFAKNFSKYGNSLRINKAMENLVKSGDIFRVARGIYCYPKIDKDLGLGVLTPSVDDIVAAIAKKENARIVPTGIWAQNKLGLSTQIPMNFVFLTDGHSRKIEILNGCSVELKHAALKNFAFTNQLALLINVALQELGMENIADSHKQRIKELLQNEKKENIERDYPHMTDWVQTIIKECYE